MKKAFTLAEVLITLTIIGVVAAVTIPSVIANYQQQEFKTGLRKAVSVLNEAIQMNIVHEGVIPYNNGDLFTYLQRHMSVIKSDFGKDWNEDGVYKTVNRSFYTTDGMRYEIPKFNDGISESCKMHESGINFSRRTYDGERNRYSFYTGQHSCGSYGLANNRHNTINPPCLLIVDVNGDKKPSKLSSNVDDVSYKRARPKDKLYTDIFTIMITEDRAIPFGVVAQRAMYEK